MYPRVMHVTSQTSFSVSLHVHFINCLMSLALLEQILTVRSDPLTKSRAFLTSRGRREALAHRSHNGHVSPGNISTENMDNILTLGPHHTTLRPQPSTPFQFLHPKPADMPVECKGLRSKRYISDGFCTSLKPVEDYVCTGSCLPIQELPWYAEYIKIWSKKKASQYQCVDDMVKHRKVTFVCQSGETRTYDIKVVRSCKCKRTLRRHNQSTAADKPDSNKLEKPTLIDKTSPKSISRRRKNRRRKKELNKKKKSKLSQHSRVEADDVNA